MTPKPNTKNKAFKNISRRFACDSDMLVPARYDKKPGIIGNTQGDKKDTSPAKKATKIDISSICNVYTNHNTFAILS